MKRISTLFAILTALSLFPALILAEAAEEAATIDPSLPAWLLAWAGVIALGIKTFEAIARMTKNKTDDKVMGWVNKVAKVLGLYYDPTDPK